MSELRPMYAIDCMDTTHGDWRWVIRESINGQVHAVVARFESQHAAKTFCDAMNVRLTAPADGREGSVCRWHKADVYVSDCPMLAHPFQTGQKCPATPCIITEPGG